MRVEGEYKKSGYFWLPDRDDEKIPGILTVQDGGQVELEIVGLFDNSITAFSRGNELERIIGHSALGVGPKQPSDFIQLSSKNSCL